LSKQTFRIFLRDYQAPQPVCITQHTATLGSDGRVRVKASTFNSNSTDNCGIQMIMVKRIDDFKAADAPFASTGNWYKETTAGAGGIQDCSQPATKSACYADYVDFVCADDTKQIMVEMLVIDQNCNANSCMVLVNVQNKQVPVCNAPPAATITCVNVEQAVADSTTLSRTYGSPSVYASCGYDRVDELKPTLSYANCGPGTITRKWNLIACDKTTVLTSCSQTITTTQLSKFTVDFPQDVTVQCFDDIQSIAALKAQMLNPNYTGDGSIKNEGCGVIVINIKDDTLMANPGDLFCAKIVRKICVYDWCKYQPNSDQYETNIDLGEVIDADKRIWRNGDAPFRGGNLDYNYYTLCYNQVIKIEDRTAPTPDVVTGGEKCFSKGANGVKVCSLDYSQLLTATDKCTSPKGSGSTDSKLLRFSWSIYQEGSDKGTRTETLKASDVTNTVKANGLAAGTYIVKWAVRDLCGNISDLQVYTFTAKDCEGPSILVHTKIAELSYVRTPITGGMVVVTVDDLFNNVDDNCSDLSVLKPKMAIQKIGDNAVYPAGQTSIMFTCTEKGKQEVRVWAMDAAGNKNFVITTVDVQDNSKACTGGPIALVGAAGTENGKAVKSVTVTAKAAGFADVNGNTINDGSYNMSIERNQDYVVGATKVDPSDKFLGVTTFDIAKISKHLLDIEKIASPYSLIAADVDMSGEIDGADMLKIRNFILRKSDNLNTNATIWRFVDKSYAFKNAASPLTEDFSTVVSLTKVGDRAVANFVAVKLGDVNTTYTGEAVATVRNAKTLNFVTEDINVVAGNEYTVNIAAENFNAAAFQGTFSFTNATVKAAKGSLLTDANMAIFSNAITTSWNGNAKADDIMAITFVANKSGKLSEVLTINSALTPAVANDVNGTEMNLNLKFTNGAVAGGEFALNNANPNPVKFETVIGFNLPKDSKATLTVYTTEGKVLSVKNVDAKAGANQITLTKGDLNAAGVMYYRLETADFSATKKMIVVE
jgi:hypothetical protein